MSSQSFFFHDQAGVIPGISGTFAHCRVDIDDEGTVTTSPLVSVEVVEGSKPVEPIQATDVQEQEQASTEENEPAPNTDTNGG